MKKTLCALLLVLTLLCACSPSSSPSDTTLSPSDPVPSDTAKPILFPEDFIPSTAKKSDIDAIDFIVDVPSGRDIKILQFSDMQIINLDETRNSTRYGLLKNAYFKISTTTDPEKKLWRHLDEAVQNTLPDLIVLAGDNVYGETDDSGNTWLAMIEKMDSYGIPWALTFGNHDNESAKGVRWQIEQIQNSKYGIFTPGTVSGNSNYNIAMRKDGEIKYMVYMLDTNGCCLRNEKTQEGILPDNIDYDRLIHTEGLQPDQVEWFKTTQTAINQANGKTVPSLVVMHIHPLAMSDAIWQRYKPTGSSLCIPMPIPTSAKCVYTPETAASTVITAFSMPQRKWVPPASTSDTSTEIFQV